MTYHNLALVKAVTSVLNAAKGLHDQSTSQKEESTPFGKKIKREDICNHDKALKDRLVSPLDDISDLDLNPLESDDNSECIFPLSLGVYNEASNSKLVSTPLPHNTDKDIQSSFTIAGSSNASFKIAGKDCNHWPKRFKSCDQLRDHRREIGLSTIPKESQEQ
jgi:hypothetical protein